jgi:hypothetical protein
VNKRKSLGSLAFLVDVLNAQTPEALDKWREQEGVEFEGVDWIEGVWPFQDELLKDLSPLFDSIPASIAERALSALLEKIEKLEFRCGWQAFPAGRTLFTIRDLARKQEQELPVLNPAYLKLGTGGAKIKIGKAGHKKAYIVSMVLPHENEPRKFLYAEVISALQSGTFSHIGRCEWEECRKFFIREDLRRSVYCSEKCARAYDRSAARIRAKEWRKAKKLEGA